jgi:threonine dehydrogenase-like Zn-dependent dehydrogenase
MSKSMRGIAATPDSASPQWVEVPEPRPPGEGELLCRTLQLGVCGTDREILQSSRPLTPPGEPFLVLGHECLARVEAVGAAVERFQPGDLVVPVVRRPTSGAIAGQAATPAGRVDLLAFGHYTERGIVQEHGFSTPWWLDRPEYLYRIPAEMEPWAVLTEPFSIAEKGINEALAVQQARLGVDAWQHSPPRVLVTGMGPIGFAALAVSVGRGWPTTLYGRDHPQSFRAQLVLEWGASFLPEAEARFEDPDSEGFDLILECTGSEQVMVSAARWLASRGVMVWLGSSRQPKPAQLNVAQLMRDGVLRNHIHIGCVNAAPRDFVDAIGDIDRLRQSHCRQLSALLTDRVSPPDALWHYQHRQPQGIKTVVEFQ